jgi:signal peptidase I
VSSDQAIASDSGDGTAPQPRRQRGVWLFVRDILLILLAALLISFVIKTFFVRSFYIPSASMVNTLEVNDRVIVSLLSPTLVPVQRGDIIVFQDPGGWLTGDPNLAPKESPVSDVLAFLGLAAPTDSDHLIKRVIGLPGDHVACCTASGELTVNGTPISEPFITLPAGVTPADPYTFSITVPKGDLWVMGDNRDFSEDSAYHYNHKDATPFVPLSDVTGKALVISWPVSRWSVLSNYPSSFGAVKSATSK